MGEDLFDKEVKQLIKDIAEFEALWNIPPWQDVPDPFNDYYGNKLPPKLRLIKGGKT